MDRITKPIIIMIVLALVAVAGLILFARPDSPKPAVEPKEKPVAPATKTTPASEKTGENKVVVDNEISDADIDEFGDPIFSTGEEENSAEGEGDAANGDTRAEDDSLGTSLPPELQPNELEDGASGN